MIHLKKVSIVVSDVDGIVEDRLGRKKKPFVDKTGGFSVWLRIFPALQAKIPLNKGKINLKQHINKGENL